VDNSYTGEKHEYNQGVIIKSNLAIFEDYKIRRFYDEKTETWFFSVLDVVAALTDCVNPRDHWFKMKIRV
jgi:DNA-damage-inducible protein D